MSSSYQKRKNHNLRNYIRGLEFNNHILQAQQELSLDGILVVDDNWQMVSFNQRFIEMWEIPQEVIDSRDDQQSIRTVLGKLKHPHQFLEKVEHLMATPDVCSRDILELMDGRVFDRYSAPILDPKNNLRGRVWFFRDITEITQARKDLKGQNTQLAKMVEERTRELKKKNLILQKRERELEKNNNSLRMLLHTMEDEKRMLKEKTQANLEKGFLPLLELIKETALGAKQQLIIEMMESQLDNLVSDVHLKLSQLKKPLTPMELQIANCIVLGKSTKEMSVILHSSERTIEGHRSSIRRKLKLKQGENLRLALQKNCQVLSSKEFKNTTLRH